MSVKAPKPEAPPGTQGVPTVTAGLPAYVVWSMTEFVPSVPLPANISTQLGVPLLASGDRAGAITVLTLLATELVDGAPEGLTRKYADAGKPARVSASPAFIA